ncbi:hypothetical protein OROHE_003423 [Orobanche hederae]
MLLADTKGNRVRKSCECQPLIFLINIAMQSCPH